VAGVGAVAWSPKGSYLETFERPDKEKGNAFKNLKVSCSRLRCMRSRGWGGWVPHATKP
jgi:hypothetical protein